MTMKQKPFLGIDVSKAKAECGLLWADSKYRSKVVSNQAVGFAQLRQWLQKYDARQAHVCMEATGVYWEELALALSAHGMAVSVVNPAQIKAFGESRLVRTKTDKVDARLIAEFCRAMQPPLWQPPSPSEQALRALVGRLDALQRMRIQESNRLGVARDAVRSNIEAHLHWLDQQIKALTQQIDRHIDQDPELRRKRDLLDTIPGVGGRTSALFLAFCSRTEAFANARQCAAFAGLNPQQHQSGSSVRHPARLSKIGHALLRKAMYMPALVTLYKTAWGKAFRSRLKAAGKPPKLIIGAMMRKLIHVAYGVIKSNKPFDPTLHTT
jgi:transposase